MGSESKPVSVLSWADEVEIEEAAAAAAQAQVHTVQKPDPFGSARPREVILVEKGIDWRKIDHHFLPISSRLRQEIHYQKLHRERISISPPVPVIDRKRSSFPVEEPKNWKPGLERTQNVFAPQNQITMIFVPPLRYPPKTIGGKLFVPEKGNMYHESEERGYHNLKPKCYIDPDFHQASPSSQNQSKSAGQRGTKFEIGYSMQAQTPNSGTPMVSHKNQQDGYSTSGSKNIYKQNMVSPSPEVVRRGPPQRDQKHTQHDSANNSTRGRLAKPTARATFKQNTCSHFAGSGNQKTRRMVASKYVVKETPFRVK